MRTGMYKLNKLGSGFIMPIRSSDGPSNSQRPSPLTTRPSHAGGSVPVPANTQIAGQPYTTTPRFEGEGTDLLWATHCWKEAGYWMGAWHRKELWVHIGSWLLPHLPSPERHQLGPRLVSPQNFLH